MPQLRDSGTRSLHATEPVPSAEMDGFCRIFGVETEYGVAVTGAERPVDAGQVAMTMFQPIVSRSRSTNTYLANGSRLYLDVGSHPEYATAEARDPREALAQDLAGEHVMRNLALKSQRKLRESYGAHATIHVFKTTSTPPATPSAATKTTWSAASCRWRPSNTSCCRSSSPASCTPVPAA